MKTLAERQAQRVIQKAEHALEFGVGFDASRSGVGEVHPRHPDAKAINEATDAKIEAVAAVIGAAPANVVPRTFTTGYQHKVKVSGI